MASSFEQQLHQIVRLLQSGHRAFLCDGDPTTAVAWSDATEITARISLRADELWVLAGSGLLARFVAPSDGQFELDTIADVIREILDGRAVEAFGQKDSSAESARVATAFAIDSGRVSGGSIDDSAFTARIASPFPPA